MLQARRGVGGKGGDNVVVVVRCDEIVRLACVGVLTINTRPSSARADLTPYDLTTARSDCVKVLQPCVVQARVLARNFEAMGDMDEPAHIPMHMCIRMSTSMSIQTSTHMSTHDHAHARTRVHIRVRVHAFYMGLLSAIKNSHVAGGKSQYTKSALLNSSSSFSSSKTSRRLEKCRPGLLSPGPWR